MLTIGMPVYDDFDGVYFTIQALRMYHDVEFELIVIDNNPNSIQGQKTKNFVEGWCKKGRYIPFTNKVGTSIKNEVFKNSNTEYTMCIDCHILLLPNSLSSLVEYYNTNPNTTDLIQGPLVYDDLTSSYTHFNDKWGSLMHGAWDTDNDSLKRGKPFEIPSMGMGLFSCRTDSWPYFHELMKGFGGEEGYIHRKFINRGDKCICIPQLKWLHRFERPHGAPYPNIIEDRLWNYYIGAFDTLDKDDSYFDEIASEFTKSLPAETVNTIFKQAEAAYYSHTNK
jgi:hypothetical protein